MTSPTVPSTSPSPSPCLPSSWSSPIAPADPELRTPSVVHLGTGGLREAHHALYVEELARRRVSDEWGLSHVDVLGAVGRGSGRVPGRGSGRERAGRHRVGFPGADAASGEVEVLRHRAAATDGAAAVVDLLRHPATRLVTTRLLDRPAGPGGVHAGPAAAVAHGYLARALAHRRAAGLPPFTVLSCDAVPRNGSATRTAVLDAARREQPGLAGWIAEHARFPSSVVDDTVPGPHLPFRWIVEDDFCDGGRPPLEEVGVQWVRTTAPHEELRRRLVDGGRYVLDLLARVTGAGTRSEAMTDPWVRAHLAGHLAQAADGLLGVPGVDVAAYRAAALRRLEAAGGPVTSWPAEAVAASLLPPLRQALDQHRPHDHLVLAVAAWLHSLPGAGADPCSVLGQHRSWLGPLGDDHHLLDELRSALRSLTPPPTAGPTAEPVTDLEIRP